MPWSGEKIPLPLMASLTIKDAIFYEFPFIDVLWHLTIDYDSWLLWHLTIMTSDYWLWQRTIVTSNDCDIWLLIVTADCLRGPLVGFPEGPKFERPLLTSFCCHNKLQSKAEKGRKWKYVECQEIMNALSFPIYGLVSTCHIETHLTKARTIKN